jgi:hypothetical protein
VVYVGFEVLTAVVVNVIFRDIASCILYENRRFGGTYLPSYLLARWFIGRMIVDHEDGDMFPRNFASYTDYAAFRRWQLSIVFSFEVISQHLPKETEENEGSIRIVGVLAETRTRNKKKTPWPELVSDIYIPSDRHLSAKLVPTLCR